MTGVRRTVFWGFALGLGVATARADEPILHEYVPDIRSASSTSYVSGDADAPSAIVYDGQILPAPDDAPPGRWAREERPMQAIAGDGEAFEDPGRRSPTFRPDRITALHERVPYYEAFTPSVVPYKRVTALDTVVLAEEGRTPVLGIGSTDLATVPIEPRPGSYDPSDRRERDLFWGTVVLDTQSGRVLPLPSVSPESNILSVRTNPDVPVRIARDRADNFYAVLPQTMASAGDARHARYVRLTFLTDAPQTYFNAPMPDLPADSLATHASRLPDALRTRALGFAAELGLAPGVSLRSALDTLTAHFRSFLESDDPPRDTGDIYLDLARGKKGVCRHRVYAFVITALALGIPARFVENEAHAWTEVEVPDLGWVRIELGGAAERLDAHGVDDRPRYRSRHPDPFPRPEAFLASLGAADAGRGVLGTTGAPRAGVGSESPAGVPPEGPRSVAPGRTADAEDPTDVGAARWESGAGESVRVAVTVALDAESFSVLRGQTLELSGRIVAGGGGGADGLRVEVIARGAEELLLGVTVSDGAGYFRGRFDVPADVPVGEYALLVRTPGDRRFLPATAE